MSRRNRRRRETQKRVKKAVAAARAAETLKSPAASPPRPAPSEVPPPEPSAKVSTAPARPAVGQPRITEHAPDDEPGPLESPAVSVSKDKDDATPPGAVTVGFFSGVGIFVRGAAYGLAVLLPLVALALIGLARAGLGTPMTGMELVRLSLVFAGLPALLAGGGVARLVWHRSAAARARGPGGSDPVARHQARRVARRTACLALAAAGGGLAVLIAVPKGGLPPAPGAFAAVFAAGALAGALAGIPLAAWVRLARRLY